MEHASLFAHLSAWLADMPRASAGLFLIAMLVTVCVVALLVDGMLRKFAALLERRAIRERNWITRHQRVQLILDAQRDRERREAEEAEILRKRVQMRVWRDRVQSNREAKQFHVDAAFRDMKGVQR